MEENELLRGWRETLQAGIFVLLPKVGVEAHLEAICAGSTKFDFGQGPLLFGSILTLPVSSKKTIFLKQWIYNKPLGHVFILPAGKNSLVKFVTESPSFDFYEFFTLALNSFLALKLYCGMVKLPPWVDGKESLEGNWAEKKAEVEREGKRTIAEKKREVKRLLRENAALKKEWAEKEHIIAINENTLALGRLEIIALELEHTRLMEEKVALEKEQSELVKKAEQPQEKGKPGRLHHADDVWAWKQIHETERNEAEVKAEWIEKIKNDQERNLIYTGWSRQFRRIKDKNWLK